MSEEEEKHVEFPKHSYTYFRTPNVVVVLQNGDKFKGRIIKNYTYEILFFRRVKLKSGQIKDQEFIIPKHSINYTYRYVEPKTKEDKD